MSVTRRAFVQTTLGGVAGLGLARTAAAASAPVGRRGGQWDPSRVSPAVLHAATVECVRVKNRAASGRLVPGDLRSLAATLRLTFAHFSEAGLPEAQERLLREHRFEALAPVPRQDDLDRVRLAVETTGIAFTPEEVQRLLSASAERKVAAVAAIEKLTVHRLQLHIADRLEKTALVLEARRKGAARRVALGEQEEELDDCQAMTLLIDALGIIVALNAAGSLVVPALLPVTAIEGVLLAVLTFIRDWFCG